MGAGRGEEWDRRDARQKASRGHSGRMLICTAQVGIVVLR
jgi:hypothetical protein